MVCRLDRAQSERIFSSRYYVFEDKNAEAQLRYSSTIRQIRRVPIIYGIAQYRVTMGFCRGRG